MTPLEKAREQYVDGLELRTDRWREIVRDAFNAGAVAAMLAKKPERTLRQRMTEAGFTRRPSAKSLPSDE